MSDDVKQDAMVTITVDDGTKVYTSKALRQADKVVVELDFYDSRLLKFKATGYRIEVEEEGDDGPQGNATNLK